MKFDTLPGFREFYPQECRRRNFIFDNWRRVAKAFNFKEYDSPVLEPLELYVEKSGEEIVGQLFNFEDRGGRAVALRPEMTPSLARLVGAKANSLKRPIKWFSIGEHYRYERPQKGRLRAFNQFNVDLLGEPSVSADAELIALLAESLKAFELTNSDFMIRLSDRTVWILLLSAQGLSETQTHSILGVIDKMERAGRDATLSGLLKVLNSDSAAEDLLQGIEALAKVRDLAQLKEVFKSFDLSSDLQEQIENRLKDWADLLEGLRLRGVEPFIQIDFSIVRGLAYYTGFVFEAFEASGAGRALAGGGRYNDLVKKLCGQDLPAVGFAIGDVTLVDLLEEKGRLAIPEDVPDFIMIIGGEAERAVALSDAAVLRSSGYQVEYPLKDIGFGKQFKEADQKGARFAIIYGSDEIEKNILKVRDLQQGTETDYPRTNLLEFAEILFEDGEDA